LIHDCISSCPRKGLDIISACPRKGLDIISACPRKGLDVKYRLDWYLNP
jgi:hypothetical protein